MPKIIGCEFVYDAPRKNGTYQYLCTREMAVVKKVNIDIFTIYFAGIIVVAKTAIEQKPNNENTFVATVVNKQVYFQYEVFNTGLNELPFIEMGYLARPDKDGYMSILYPIESSLRRLINRSSEKELSIALHAFLQKYQFSRKCRHVAKDEGRCENGTMSVSRAQCKSCKGTGKEIITSVQDVMLFELPENKDEYFPLSEMTHWPTMPFEIVNFLTEEIPSIMAEMEQTMWGINIATPPKGTTITAATATEVIGRYDTIYKRLACMGAQIERIWAKCLRVTASYAEVSNGLIYRYEYPASYQMETLPELFTILSSAKEAGAPFQIIAAIEMQIMKKQGRILNTDIKWHTCMNEFKPFKSRSASDISIILSGLSETYYYKVLWNFFDEIFEEIKQEQPDFIFMNFSEKQAIVKSKVSQFSEMLALDIPEAAPLRQIATT
jgi:hypothetical protein